MRRAVERVVGLLAEAHAAQHDAHRLWLARAIEAGLDRFDRGETPSLSDTDIPPGSPIGADSCWHCDSAAMLGLGR